MSNQENGSIFFVGQRKTSAIEIDILSESHLVPVIVSEIFSVSESNDVVFKGNQWIFSRHNVTELLKEYFPNADELYETISRVTDCEARAACAVAYMFHSDRRSEKLSDLYMNLSEFCTSKNARWFPQVCVWALTPLFKTDKEAALSVIALLAQAVGDRFDARYSLEAGLSLWREIDHAPVTTVFNEGLWKYEWT
jgi:hypothetical protein